MLRPIGRLLQFVWSVIDPRASLHLLRVAHFYQYSHIKPRRELQLGANVTMAPNVSLRNGSRIQIGAHSHIGERSCLWGGDATGRIVIGEYALFGPEVFVTASDYGMEPGTPVMLQPRRERDVVIGRDVWLGARVIVVAGVTIGDGSIVGAGSVVTRSLPPSSIAAGIPARVIRMRDGSAVPQVSRAA